MPKPWKEKPPESPNVAEPTTEENISNYEAAMFAAEIGIAPQIDLHGETVDIALGNLSTFIHQSFMRDAEAVRVVHGRGLGKLREAVRDWLQNNPKIIAAYRDASSPAQQGGMTVVALHRRGPKVSRVSSRR